MPWYITLGIGIGIGAVIGNDITRNFVVDQAKALYGLVRGKK